MGAMVARQGSPETDPKRTEAWGQCFRLLPGVSRTFALAIDGLREPLRGAVCVSYLLCRILDTAEDAPELTSAQRGALVFPFLHALAGRAPLPAEWAGEARRLLGPRASESDLDLVLNTPSVLKALYSLEPSVQSAVVRWVTEMGRGMVAYSARMGETGIKSLPDMAALDRYCYYIAGTVGYLLTDLFFLNSPAISRELFYALQEDAEAFGLGLQKVNILKDMGDDARRGWCFVPRDLLAREGLAPADVADESKGPALYRACLPVLRSATDHLQRGWRYLSRMPVEEREIRLFLGYSLFFAARTLALVAEDSRRLWSPDEKLKISRLEVASVVAGVQLAIDSPKKLQALWHKTAAPLAKFEAAD